MNNVIMDKVLAEVEEEFGMAGLSIGLYADYAKAVTEKYIKLTSSSELSNVRTTELDENIVDVKWESALKLLEADNNIKHTYVLGKDAGEEEEPQLYRQSSYQLGRTLFHNPNCDIVVFEHDHQKFYVVNAVIDETKGNYKILRFKLADQSLLAVLDSIKYSQNPDNTKEVIEFIKSKHMDPGPCPYCNDQGEIESDSGPSGCGPCNSRLIPFINTKGKRDYIDWEETLELRGDGLHLIKPKDIHKEKKLKYFDRYSRKLPSKLDSIQQTDIKIA
jgi:hypothetical protein